MLRHDINPRWIGDLLAAFCATCNHLVVPLPSSPPAIAAVSGARWRTPAPERPIAGRAGAPAT